MRRVKGIIRSLSYFPDKEGKTRVIAILDYWTQTCLRPMHSKINRLLEKIDTDCTFNQNHFQTCLPSKATFHSLDLKSATDRMPLSFQKRVVAFLLGTKSLADDWGLLLTELGYHHSDGIAKYNAGQPMGCYTS